MKIEKIIENLGLKAVNESTSTGQLWITPVGSETKEIISPVDGKKIASVVFATESEYNHVIKKAEEAGVHITACGFSLNKFKVDKKKIPKGIKIVENGILYNFQLQKKGYKSLSL